MAVLQENPKIKHSPSGYNMHSQQRMGGPTAVYAHYFRVRGTRYTVKDSTGTNVRTGTTSRKFLMICLFSYYNYITVRRTFLEFHRKIVAQLYLPETCIVFFELLCFCNRSDEVHPVP